MNTFYKIITTMLVFLFSSTLYAATIAAQLDVSPVIISDSFQLTYTAEGSVDDDPDFAPIQKDFNILGTRTSSNISMINGDFKRTKKWILSLAAKNTGTFIVPAIKFGKDLAPEVEITVETTPASSANIPSQDFLVELEASTKSAFIQQQIIITARLLIAKNISNYQFSELRIDDSDTMIKAIGKDRQYKTYRGSKAFIIIERQFAVFPQHQGTLTIQPFVAEVGIASNNARGSFFDPFNNYTTKKRIQSNTLSIKISDIPTSFTAKNWLPSSSIKLKEDWPQGATFTAGEPITRTITIMADALTSAQLPELDIFKVTGLKQYPDKPVLEDKFGGKGITSIRKEKIAFIPTKAGTYTLPAIDIPWWNTKTNKIDIAHISKRSFKVQAATATEQAPAISQTNVTNKPQTIQPIKGNSVISDTQVNSFWPWLSLALLLLWIATLVLLFKTKRSTKIHKTSIDKTPQAQSTSLKYLKIACKSNNPQKAKSALLQWAAALFDNVAPNNLSDLAALVPENIAKEILELNTALYSSHSAQWQCGELYNLCRFYKRKNTNTDKNINSAKLENIVQKN